MEPPPLCLSTSTPTVEVDRRAGASNLSFRAAGALWRDVVSSRFLGDRKLRTSSRGISSNGPQSNKHTGDAAGRVRAISIQHERHATADRHWGQHRGRWAASRKQIRQFGSTSEICSGMSWGRVVSGMSEGCSGRTIVAAPPSGVCCGPIDVSSGPRLALLRRTPSAGKRMKSRQTDAFT